MTWRMKSLAEDDVDVCTHTTSVVFFLILSFLVLVIPPSPSPNTPEVLSPIYVASCWCPAQFEESQVTYTNNVCGESFNAMIQGKEYDYAKIFMTSLINLRLPKPEDLINIIRNASMIVDSPDKDEGDPESDKKPSIPVAGVLFLLAVCLRIPHVFRSILSSCTNGVNTNETLQAAKMGSSMDEDRRKQLYSRLIKVFTGSSRGCQNSSAYLYIFMKCMFILVITVEIILVASHSHIITQNDNKTVVDDKATLKNDSTNAMEQKINLDQNAVYHCYFEIRQMTNVHDYSVQCAFKRQQSEPPVTTEETSPGSALDFPGSMLFNVHIMVISILVVLAVANVFSTVCLLSNLCGTSRRMQMGLNTTAPLDLVLLIYMARTNVDVLLAEDLAELAAVNSEPNRKDQII